MPYVKQADRGALNPLAARDPENPGELNFQFTQLITAYVHQNGLRYQTINDVLGALDGAGKEFYRRVAVPYENGKIATNGDVYDGIHRSNER